MTKLLKLARIQDKKYWTPVLWARRIMAIRARPNQPPLYNRIDFQRILMTWIFNSHQLRLLRGYLIWISREVTMDRHQTRFHRVVLWNIKLLPLLQMHWTIVRICRLAARKMLAKRLNIWRFPSQMIIIPIMKAKSPRKSSCLSKCIRTTQIK